MPSARLNFFSMAMQIALRREKMGETAPFWGFFAASYPVLEGNTPFKSPLWKPNQSINGNSIESSGVSDFPIVRF